MRTQTSAWRFGALSLALAACSGGGGGGGPPVVIPEVPVGAFEAGCQQLCTLSGAETVCTPKHAAYCLARCRARTGDLASACGDCLITVGTPISGYVDTATHDGYCTIGGPGSLATCATACDDAGAAPPSPDLDVLCQLECSFYLDKRVPLACSADAAADCLASCRASIAANGRVCAQCFIERTGHGEICLNSECDCLNSFDTSGFGCDTLCDALPPM